MMELENVYFINLDERVDRLQHMQSQLSLMGWQEKAIRFSAKKAANGAVGCSMSHLELLKHAQANNLPYIVILEDDVVFHHPARLQAQIRDFFRVFSLASTSWDVLLLGGNNVAPVMPVTECESVVRVSKCQTTTAYIVNQHYYPKLMQNFRNGIVNLLKNAHLHHLYAIDKYWFQLQQHDNWFLPAKLTVSQLPGFSNIENRVVNYDRAMLTLDKSEWTRQK